MTTKPKFSHEKENIFDAIGVKADVFEDVFMDYYDTFHGEKAEDLLQSEQIEKIENMIIDPEGNIDYIILRSLLSHLHLSFYQYTEVMDDIWAVERFVKRIVLGAMAGSRDTEDENDKEKVSPINPKNKISH